MQIYNLNKKINTIDGALTKLLLDNNITTIGLRPIDFFYFFRSAESRTRVAPTPRVYTTVVLHSGRALSGRKN